MFSIKYTNLFPAIVLILLFALVGKVKAQENALSLDELMASQQISGPLVWLEDGERVMYKIGGAISLINVIDKSSESLPSFSLGGTGHFLRSQNIKLSPQGDQFAYVSNKEGNPEIWLHSVGSGEDRKLTNLGQAAINALSWSSDGTWITFSGNRYGNYDIWKVSVDSGQVHRMTSGDLYEVYPSFTPDGNHILYVKLNKAWTTHDVIKIDAKDASNPQTLVQDKDFFDYHYGAAFGFPEISPDGDRFLFRSQRSGWINYWVQSLDGGKATPLHQEQADQSNAMWSPDGSKVLFTSNHNGTHVLNVASMTDDSNTKLVDPKMGVVSEASWSPDGKRIIYALETPASPNDIFVVNSDGSNQRQLTNAAPMDNYQQRLTQPKKINYESTDGLTISAYLYEPPKPGTYPGIMWIHGGPTGQFNDTFQPEVQYFVNNGYVVLQPNIRGSSGYGKAFEKANQKCWGHCDLEDVRKGVEYLKTLDKIDPDEMGIHGTSYGGIMSMAAAAFAPDLFQASVPASGYGDWVSFYHNPNELRHYKLSNYELGPFGENEDIWKAASAIYSVDQIKTPMFLVHGEGKYPPSPQSEQFAKELEAHYKTFKYKAYPNENYYVRGKENRIQMLQDIREFLDKFLKGNVITH